MRRFNRFWENNLGCINRISDRNDDWHNARNGFNRTFNRSGNNRLSYGFRQFPVHGQGNRSIPSPENESVGGNLPDSRILWNAFQMNAIVLIVIEIAQTLESGGAGFAQVVDEELDVELGRIGGAQTDATGKIGLNACAQWNNAHLGDVNGFRELHQVKV